MQNWWSEEMWKIEKEIRILFQGGRDVSDMKREIIYGGWTMLIFIPYTMICSADGIRLWVSWLTDKIKHIISNFRTLQCEFDLDQLLQFWLLFSLFFCVAFFYHPNCLFLCTFLYEQRKGVEEKAPGPLLCFQAFLYGKQMIWVKHWMQQNNHFTVNAHYRTLACYLQSEPWWQQRCLRVLWGKLLPKLRLKLHSLRMLWSNVCLILSIQWANCVTCGSWSPHRVGRSTPYKLVLPTTAARIHLLHQRHLAHMHSNIFVWLYIKKWRMYYIWNKPQRIEDPSLHRTASLLL